uniref:Uncharacterized protein n=1 Tax=viral metagenome TaxID=1070528 RepID=A0A6M3J2K8_9ZZZZ
MKRIYERSRVDSEITRITAQLVDIDAKLAVMAEGQPKQLLKLRRLSLAQRLTFYETYVPVDGETVSIWCADYTQDLTGNVGTIEINGTADYQNVQPGYDGNAVYSGTRDGILQKTMAMTPSGAVFNSGIVSGWQRWKPTYRTGTITSITDDTADVTLAAAIDKFVGQDINQTVSLSSVEIDYMTCHGLAFKVGDEVIIQFTGQDWTAPKIIGFKQEPKPCGLSFKLYDEESAVVDESTLLWFQMYDHNGDEISVSYSYDSPSGRWILTPGEEDPEGYYVAYKRRGGVESQYYGVCGTSRYFGAYNRVEPIGAYEDTILDENTWNPDNPSVVEIGQPGDFGPAITLTVMGGKAPYTWEYYAPTMYHWELAEETGEVNYLRAHSDAEGAVYVGITDACGTVASAMISASDGYWVAGFMLRPWPWAGGFGFYDGCDAWYDAGCVSQIPGALGYLDVYEDEQHFFRFQEIRCITDQVPYWGPFPPAQECSQWSSGFSTWYRDQDVWNEAYPYGTEFDPSGGNPIACASASFGGSCDTPGPMDIYWETAPPGGPLDEPHPLITQHACIFTAAIYYYWRKDVLFYAYRLQSEITVLAASVVIS